MSLTVVSTSSQSRRRRPPDVGALVADLRREHGKRASAALYEMLLEDEAVARALCGREARARPPAARQDNGAREGRAPCARGRAGREAGQASAGDGLGSDHAERSKAQVLPRFGLCRMGRGAEQASCTGHRSRRSGLSHRGSNL
jgi:hypothetical protein